MPYSVPGLSIGSDGDCGGTTTVRCQSRSRGAGTSARGVFGYRASFPNITTHDRKSFSQPSNMLVLVTTFGGAAAWYWTPRHCGMVGRLTSVCTLRSESAVRYPQTRKSGLSNRRTCSLTLYNLQP